MDNKFEILTFKDGDFSLPVNVSPKEDTVWLSLNDIAALFEKNKSTISRHINNIYDNNELLRISTVAKNATVQLEGERNVSREIDLYNLDVILSVGYRVNGKRGTLFRQWANYVLKQYIFAKPNFSCLECKEKIIDLQKQIYKIKDFQNKSLTLKETDHIDALFMLEEIMKSAKHLLVIVDNYFDHSFDEILLHSPAKVVVITHPNNVSFESEKYKIIKVNKFHDRYLFVDDKAYHFGESFTRLGTDISTCSYMPNFTIDNFLEISGLKI